MIEFDMHTVLFSYLVTLIVSTIVMVLLWLQNQKRFEGTSFWVVDFVFQTFGLLFIALRGNIPDWISIVLSNGLIMTGMLLGLMGLERFVGKRRSHLQNYMLVIVYISIHTWFTFAQPDLANRTLNSLVFMLIFGSQIVWLLYFRVSEEMKKLTSLVAMVFVILCLFNLCRLIDFFVTAHTTTDYFQSTGFEAYNIILSQMVFILLTFSLTLMFNRRLLAEIAVEEEKFSKAFHSSPYAIMLTRFADDRIFEVNKGFANITGFEYTEVIGKTTHDLHFWEREEDRALVVAELQELGKVHEREFQFRIKSGDKITCLFSAEIITFNKEKCLLASINDITYRKLSSEKLHETMSYLENLINYANAPIIVWDTNFSITKFNHAFERLTGRTFQEVEGKKIDLLFPEKSKELALQHIFQTAKGERMETVEIEIQDREGIIKTVLWNSACIYDSTNENIVATIAQGHEITLRLIAEEQVRRLNEKLEQQVAQRTAELQKTISELEEQSRAFVGRELRIIELNKLVARLENSLSGIREKES